MKLSIVFVMIFCLGVSASSYSQQEKVTLSLNKVGIKTVFKQIKTQTGLDFVYNADLLKDLKQLSIEVENVTVSKVLNDVFEDSEFNFRFVDKVIIISPKSRNVIQTDKRIITGRVVDQKGNPLPGVAVVVQGLTVGTATDNRGRYKLKVSPKDALTFSFIGMKTVIVLVEDKEKIDVTLFSKNEELEEVSVVAFGEQKKESVVSAITTVKADALKTSNSDLTTSFQGKIPGMIAWQTHGMPGALTEDEMGTKFYIRGITSYQTGANIDPLILLDGMEISKLDLARVNPDDIESFNVLKDASATAMYGARGANGVIYIKTKKGKSGNIYTTFRYERIYSAPTNQIDVVDPKGYMRLFNEALINRNNNSTPLYTKERIDNTGSGRYPDYVYPGTNWYEKLFKENSINNHYTLNISGGSDKVQYRCSVSHNNDKGIIKSDPLNQFDSNIENRQTNFRININCNLNKTAKLAINSFSTYDDYNGPLINAQNAYYLALNTSPVDYAPTYPADENYNWPHILFGGKLSEGGNVKMNPYAEIQKGYSKRVRFSTINKFEYIQNLSSFIKGLEFRAMVGIQKNGYFSNQYSYIPAYYSLADYNFVTGEHRLLALNEQYANQKLRKTSGGSSKNSETISDYQMTLLHTAAWGDHQTSLTTVFTAREKNLSTPRSLVESLSYRNCGVSCRGTYGYKDKYFAELSFGLNGSERFAESNRIGFFPALGAAWIVSKEDFMRSTSEWLSFLKFRFSYGRIGNDGVINRPRFLFLEEVDSSLKYIYVGSPMQKKNWYNIFNYANTTTEWEISEQYNFGTELKLFNGLFETNFDIYQEIRHNIYDYRRTLPASLGLFTNPLDNVGKVRSRGIDLSWKLQHSWDSSFWGILSGTLTYSKAKYLELEEATGKPEWQKKVGKEISQQYCYIADGLFQDWGEIENAAFQSGDVQPGDIRYRDINKDGVIDANDAVHAGFPETPRMVYGLSGFIHYKGFEFAISFQGLGDRAFFIDPKAISPFGDGRAVLKDIAQDHWTGENQKTRPFWPGLSDSNIVDHNPQEDYYNANNAEIRKSTYFMRNGKFLRCQSIELGYYLNKNWLEKYKIKNCRLYLRSNNPFIVSSFDTWDIELGENGFNYPLQKTFSAGLSLSF